MKHLQRNKDNNNITGKEKKNSAKRVNIRITAHMQTATSYQHDQDETSKFIDRALW